MENEKIIGVYPCEIAGGTIKSYDAYFTNLRIIGSYRETRAFYSKYYSMGCFLWGYKFIDWAIVVPLTKRKNLITSQNPDEILQADKRNVQYSYQDIQSATFKRVRGSWGQRLIEVITTAGKKKRFLYDPKQREEVIKIWQEVMPDKVTVQDK